MTETKEIEELIKAISKFPGLGPKSAKRIILKLINNKDEIMKPTINALVNAYKNISKCNYCGVLKSSKDECNGFNNCSYLQKNFQKFVLLKLSEINGVLKTQTFLEVISIFLVELFLDRWIKIKMLVESLKDRVKKQNIEEVI